MAEQPDETLRLLDDAIELLEIGHGGGYPEEVYESIMDRYDNWKKLHKREIVDIEATAKLMWPSWKSVIPDFERALRSKDDA